MNYATCCHQGNQRIEYQVLGVGKAGWVFRSLCEGKETTSTVVNFCPFCGSPLNTEGRRDNNVTKPQRLCFDVDGVLCDDRDQSIPYDERPPYPYAVEALRKLADAGFEIIVQTARHMMKYDGNQQRAHDYGFRDLVRWLKKHGIPFDEVYMGKASAHRYIDDRGYQVRSNRGNIDWEALLADLLKDK